MARKEGGKQENHPEAEIPGKHIFTNSDRAMLARYGDVAETVARLFGSGCEVVIHSLEDISRSVVKAVNGNVTGRVVGSPMTDLGLEVLNRSIEAKEDIMGPYFSKTKAGKPLKSVKMLLRNDKDVPIGFLCINFDLSIPMSRFLEEFSPAGDVPQSGEHFAPDVGELVAQAVADELGAISCITGVSPTEKNRGIVARLEQRHLFDIKGSVDLVAGELGVTRHTVYKYLREMRGGK